MATVPSGHKEKIVTKEQSSILSLTATVSFLERADFYWIDTVHACRTKSANRRIRKRPTVAPAS